MVVVAVGGEVATLLGLGGAVSMVAVKLEYVSGPNGICTPK